MTRQPLTPAERARKWRLSAKGRAWAKANRAKLAKAQRALRQRRKAELAAMRAELARLKS